ncbi:hypothetical protein L0337_04625 [candidate division KSB1 bacterium]|nr:hypothetical protein [candidate division KSB1 bacterium]
MAIFFQASATPATACLGRNSFLMHDKIEPQNRTSNLSTWLFLFAFAYAFMHVVPAFLTHDIKNHLTTGDLLNFFTPFVVIPSAWKLYFVIRGNLQIASEQKIRFATIILFFASIFYVNGQGMNLSANAIARHLVGMEKTPLYWLDYFFDEKVGHIFWHSGMLGISISFLLLAANLQTIPTSWPALAGAPFYSFAYFTDAVEGQTVALLFPSAILILGGILLHLKKQPNSLKQNPVMLFFLVGYVIAVALFLIWWIWQGGFPQFSELGWV